jgi:hypothetical protein
LGREGGGFAFGVGWGGRRWGLEDGGEVGGILEEAAGGDEAETVVGG